jgi:hypothetical protein
MTVGKLRAALEKFPEDTLVCIFVTEFSRKTPLHYAEEARVDEWEVATGWMPEPVGRTVVELY